MHDFSKVIITWILSQVCLIPTLIFFYKIIFLKEKREQGVFCGVFQELKRKLAKKGHRNHKACMRMGSMYLMVLLYLQAWAKLTFLGLV